MAESVVIDKPLEPSDPKQERERSTIDFPYVSLDDAVTVAKSVHKLGGNQCRLDSLAADLGHETINSGGFRQKLSAAHTFGFTALSQGVVSLTSLGIRVVDTEQERAARAEAFLKVPLYGAIYEEFKNGALPPAEGLEAKMLSLGVSNKMKGRARQVFQRSAKEAGFFAYGTTKLIYPALGTAVTPKPKESADHTPETKNGSSNGGDGGGSGKKRHPLIEGLLTELPDPQTEWTTEDRKKWLEMASTIFNVIYRDSDDSRGVVRVTVEKSSSAK